MTTFENQTRFYKNPLDLLRSTTTFAKNLGETALLAIAVVPHAIHEATTVSQLTFDGAHALIPEHPEKSSLQEVATTLPIKLPSVHSHSPRHSRETDASLVPAATVIHGAQPQFDDDFLFTHPRQLNKHGVEVENIPFHSK
jgi:hypothetical protein